MWKAQLKIGSKTFTKPKVKLKVDNTPDSNKCCEEAKEKYINNFLETLDLTSKLHRLRQISPKEAYKSMFRGNGIADRSCEEFRRWVDTYVGPSLQKISDEWEECDNVESTTQS
jgi:prophage antirepressor-like protein